MEGAPAPVLAVVFCDSDLDRPAIVGQAALMVSQTLHPDRLLLLTITRLLLSASQRAAIGHVIDCRIHEHVFFKLT